MPETKRTAERETYQACSRANQKRNRPEFEEYQAELLLCSVLSQRSKPLNCILNSMYGGSIPNQSNNILGLTESLFISLLSFFNLTTEYQRENKTFFNTGTAFIDGKNP